LRRKCARSTLYTGTPVWTGVCTLVAAGSVQSPSGTTPPVRKVRLCTLRTLFGRDFVHWASRGCRAAPRAGLRAAPRAGRTPAHTRPARRKPRSRTRGTPRACSLLPSWPRVLSLFASLPYECAAGAGRGAMSRYVSGGVRTSREDRADADPQHVTRRRDMA
jgi:hypothetical protein